MESIEGEQDVNNLLSYAKLCKEWGSPECEEAALRRVLQLDLSNQDRIFSLQALLYFIIDERLSYAAENELIGFSRECIRLSSEAISLLSDDHGAEWANLVNLRAMRYLELARAGDTDATSLASIDLENYIDWIKNGINVPDDWNKENLIAFATIDLAETKILSKTDLERASYLIESSIQTLEKNRVGSWSTDHAYELLDRVLAPAKFGPTFRRKSDPPDRINVTKNPFKNGPA